MAQLKDTLIQGSARVTDTLYANNINGLTLTAATTGFTIAGGTTSKTLTVNETYTLGAACAKGVTDNSSATAVTSSDTNLITGRTLYYAGYLSTSGGTINGNLTLAATSSGDSPSLIFDRTGSNSTDWKLVVTSGKLSFQSRTGTNAFTERGHFGDNNGAFSASSFNGLSLTAATTGFTISGGTTSKTLTVADTATINAPTQWGVVYGGASNSYASTAAGTSGQYLRCSGDAAPIWNYVTTQDVIRPSCLQGVTDNTIQTLISTVRANRLAFLPASQIIIEQTIDGGTTWTDAGISDSDKLKLFSEQRTSNVIIPLLNDVRNINCGLRITFTAMKYDVPANTAETAKYTYWNSNYISAAERYCQLKDFYFWVNARNDGIKIIIQRAKGNDSNNWVTVFNNDNYAASGSAGANYVRVSQNLFGGFTTQPSNFWNYRITFFTRGVDGGTNLSASSVNQAQNIQEIRGYGDSCWTSGNQYMYRDHIYRFDESQNVVFPAAVTATLFSGALDASKLTGTMNIARLPGISAIGTAGQILTVNSSANGLTWSNLPSGVTLAQQTSNSIQLCGAASTSASTLELTKSTVYVTSAGHLYADAVHNAVWNDYAEYRQSRDFEPGRCVQENNDGWLTRTQERLIPGASIISDTWGHVMGETEYARVPIAVSGRVLAYPYRNRKAYHAGMTVCCAPNGTVDFMTRDEIMKYPDCIVGIVSEVPEYEYWGSGQVPINGRIWIKVK